MQFSLVTWPTLKIDLTWKIWKHVLSLFKTRTFRYQISQNTWFDIALCTGSGRRKHPLKIDKNLYGVVPGRFFPVPVAAPVVCVITLRPCFQNSDTCYKNAGSKVRTQIALCFYLEYEYESELGRVTYCLYTYTCLDMCHTLKYSYYITHGGEVNVT